MASPPPQDPAAGASATAGSTSTPAAAPATTTPASTAAAPEAPASAAPATTTTAPAIPGDDTPLEAEAADPADNTDSDSALGDDVTSSTASINTEILRYREENGRTYHGYKDGKYHIPNDAREQDRLDLQHHLFLLTFDNKLHLSPAGQEGGRKLQRVLDVGTGTGVWAVDFADEHPEAEVIGVDLSPIQPAFVPPNVNFQVDDLEEPWTFGEPFDFIYSRMMTASFADWPRFFEQSFASLRPGGWLELADISLISSDDDTLKEDSALKRWADQLLDGTRLIGRPFDGAGLYKQQLEAAGFINVVEIKFKWPQNQWPKDQRYKEIGMWMLENMLTGVEGLSAAVYTRVLQWSKEQLDVFLADVRKDMRDTRIHSYWPIYVVYGQKPE